MDFSSDRRIAPVLSLVLLLVPLSVYVIGDWLGTGVQWALFRYQETFYGPSLITVASDAGYVGSGLITGKTAVSFVLWDAGALVIVAACAVVLFAVAEGRERWIRYAGWGIAFSGVLFLASCIVQYGPLFSAPSGISVPFGLPLVFAVGWLLFSGDWTGDEEEDEKEGAEEGAEDDVEEGAESEGEWESICDRTPEKRE